MKQREKRLLIGLAAILGLWQGSALLDSFVFQPVADREREIATRENSVSSKKKQLRDSLAAARKLKEWNQRSLPPDSVVATNAYQSWLIELATKSKLANVVVTPNKFGAKPKGETYTVVSATIKAQGTLAHLCDFLYEFRRSGLLHRVASMNLTTEKHQGDPVLALTLTVEGLALPDAPPRTALLSDPNLADLPGDKPPRDRQSYAPIAAKNLFVRGYNGPPKPPGPAKSTSPASPEEDPREFVFLVGSVSTNGVFDATLYDRANNKTRTLVAGSDFSVAGVEGEVVAVEIDAVTLRIKGEVFRLELGESLAHLRKLAAPAKAATSPPEAAGASDAG